MPRRPRFHVAGGVYHVTLRGNHRQPIFHAESDRDLLEDLLADSLCRDGCEVHAYCWMTNHIHLAVRVGGERLGRFVQHFASRYARTVQRRVPTTGHLFERRYRASLVETDEYLMALIRYIHMNPVRARLVEDPADYRWSSHRSYMGLARVAWLQVGLGLSLYGADVTRARAAYQQFMRTAPESEEIARIRAGGRADPSPLDGAGSLPAQRSCPTGPPGAATRATLLESLITAMARDLGVSAVDLSMPSRARHLCRARAMIAHRALEKKLATLTEIAARFGRTPAAVWMGLQRYGRDASEFDPAETTK